MFRAEPQRHDLVPESLHKLLYLSPEPAARRPAGGEMLSQGRLKGQGLPNAFLGPRLPNSSFSARKLSEGVGREHGTRVESRGHAGLVSVAPHRRAWLPGRAGQQPPPARSQTFPPNRHSNLDAGNKTQQANKPEHSLGPPAHARPACPLPAASALRGTPSGGRPLPGPPREGPRLFAMNMTFILLGCVQSQVRLLQIEYRNIHFSFQKRALKCQIKLNEIIASGGTQISCRWCCPPANSPNLLAPPQSRPTWARLGRVHTHLLDERMAFASV